MGGRRGMASEIRAEARGVEERSVAAEGAAVAAGRGGGDGAHAEQLSGVTRVTQGSMRTSSDTMFPRISSRSILLGDSFVANTVYDSRVSALQIV